MHARRPSRRRLATVLVPVALVVLLLVGAGALWLNRQVDPGGGGRRVTIEVPEGSSAQRIAEILDDKGVVGNARVFRLYVQAKGAGPFQAGSYTLPRGAPFDDVITTLEKGPEDKVERLTVPEGLTLRQIAERVGQLPGRSAERFLEVAGGGEVRSRYQPQGSSNLEGLILPETYGIDEKDDERAILERMVGSFDQAAAQAGLDEVSQGGVVSPYQAVIVASLVEEEARVPEDRGMIARVIYNRLKARKPLEIDYTLIYAQGQSGEKNRVLNEDKKVDSPYNTYKVKGLPPTPIAAPGRPSLEAAIDPPDGPWLYYVVIDANGRHAFATTLDEHNRNIAVARANGVR